MDALKKLELGLIQIASRPLAEDGVWVGSPMTSVLSKLQREFDSIAEPVNRQSIESALRSFQKVGRFTTFREMKYVCFGASSEQGNWCLFGDENLLNVLLKEVDRTVGHRRLKCFQGLLRSYLTTSGQEDRNPKQEITSGRQSIRKWLDRNLAQIYQELERRPAWLELLWRHRNLLVKEKPCQPYGEALLRDEPSLLEEVRKGLAIPDGSWVVTESVYSFIIAATKLSDGLFQERLDTFLRVATGNTEVSLGNTLKIRCVALLVSRYARCNARPEHHGLRDSAVQLIGNPWLNRQAWDAWVRTSAGKPDEMAWQMIYSWLKVALIRDFFELLSADGATDRRRLNYWLRFEPAINDLWLVMGPKAVSHPGKAYQEVRKRARGRSLRLENCTQENNAFVMHIGEWTIVEFGELGNACYVYGPGKCPFKLNHRDGISVADLKKKAKAELWLPHHSEWENVFDASICDRVKFWPNTKAFDTLIRQYSLQFDDRRASGGYFWVHADDSNSQLSARLRNRGFTYRSGKGWFKEDGP